MKRFRTLCSAFLFCFSLITNAYALEETQMNSYVDMATMIQNKLGFSSNQWVSSSTARAYMTFALVFNFSMDSHTRAGDKDLAYLEKSFFYQKDDTLLVLVHGTNMLNNCSIVLKYDTTARESSYTIYDENDESFDEVKRLLETKYGASFENDAAEVYNIAYQFGYVGNNVDDDSPEEEKETFDSQAFEDVPKINDCFSCGLINYRDHGKWGYLDPQGDIAIQPQWDYAESFEEGYACVFNGSLNERGNPAQGSYAIINTDGEYVTPLIECNGISFDLPHDESILVSYKIKDYDWEYEFWSFEGKPLSGKRWTNYDYESGNGLHCVCQDGKWGYVDCATDQTVIDFEFDDAEGFSNGIAKVAVREADRKLSYFFIDSEGNPVIPNAGWDCAYSFESGSDLTKVFQGTTLYDGEVPEKGKYAFINRSGHFVTDYDWDDAKIISDNLAAVAQLREGELKWGIIDHDGNIVAPLQWDYISYFNNGCAYVFCGEVTSSGYPSNGLYGFIDEAGRIISDIQWNDVGEFTPDGYAVVEKASEEKQNLCGIINRDGEIIIPVIWEDIGASRGYYDMFVDELCPVKQDRMYGYINKDGDLVIDTEWDKAATFMNGMAVVWESENWYIIDCDEHVIVSSRTVGN